MCHADCLAAALEEDSPPPPRKWKLKDRKFLWETESKVASSAFQKLNNVLVVGYVSGVFALYEMPGCIRYTFIA